MVNRFGKYEVNWKYARGSYEIYVGIKLYCTCDQSEFVNELGDAEAYAARKEAEAND